MGVKNSMKSGCMCIASLAPNGAFVLIPWHLRANMLLEMSWRVLQSLIFLDQFDNRSLVNEINSLTNVYFWMRHPCYPFVKHYPLLCTLCIGKCCILMNLLSLILCLEQSELYISLFYWYQSCSLFWSI